MDRRAFFTKGAGKAAQAVSKHIAEKARDNAKNWIRPPFAIEELDFLIACNRCGDCVDACPHNIVFSLPSRLGAKVFSTPALDLLNQGCHLCEGWPCVQACESRALQSPDEIESQEEVANGNKSRDEEDGENVNEKEINFVVEPLIPEEEKIYNEKILPKIANVFINKKTCLPYSGPECGACHVCPVEGAMMWSMEKPEINQALCTGCGLCREACIVEPKAIIVQSKYKAIES